MTFIFAIVQFVIRCTKSYIESFLLNHLEYMHGLGIFRYIISNLTKTKVTCTINCNLNPRVYFKVCHWRNLLAFCKLKHKKIFFVSVNETFKSPVCEKARNSSRSQLQMCFNACVWRVCVRACVHARVCVCVLLLYWGLTDCQSRKHGKTNEGIMGSSSGQHESDRWVKTD